MQALAQMRRGEIAVQAVSNLLGLNGREIDRW
jgi:hypothetical protein